MAKARILKVVNYREEDIPTLKKLEEILKREGKEYTDLVREFTTDYVKKHGDGNPAYPLDAWGAQPEMLALPTPWEDPSEEKLRLLSPADAERMVQQMAKWYPHLTRIKGQKARRGVG